MMRTPIIAGLGVAVSLALSVTPIAAQEWRASAQAGRIRSTLDPAAAGSFALGLQYDDLTTSLRLTGGIPIGSDDAMSGGASLWKRLAVRSRGAVAGIDLTGSGFVAADRSGQQPTGPVPGPFDPPAPVRADVSGHALAGQAMPVLGYEGSVFQVHARAGLSRYTATFGEQRSDRSARLADVQLTIAPTSSVAILPVVRRVKPSGEAASTFAGLSAVTASTLGSLSASIGQWSGGESEGTPWSVGGRLQLHQLVSLDGGVRRDTYDPLYLQPAQTSWSIGLSVLLAGRARRVTAPVPATYVGGRATVRLPASAASTRPSIAGDFNAWKPVPMEREGDHWIYTVAIQRGVYNYAFVRADGTWFVPENVPGRKDDGMGGHVAVLVVR